MTDPLEIVWTFFDNQNLLLSHAEIQRWPPDAFDKLMLLNFVREAGSIDHVACPSCPDRHVEEVVCIPGADDVHHLFIACPANLRVEISPDALRCWMIDVDAVARGLADVITPGGRCTARIASRLWRLGTVSWQGVNREVLLARGLSWPDGGELVQRIGGSGRAIVLVAGAPPPEHIWPELKPTVVALPSVVHLDADTIKIALGDVFALMRNTDAANQMRQPVALSPKQRKREFRNAAGELLKSKLSDDILVQAYLEHGTYRAAADALTDQLGYKISKDAIGRAVKKAGGIEAVRCDVDTDSVRRTVASQRRDRRKKYASPAQPPGVE